MALKLNGKDDHLRRKDFHALARTAGMKAKDADRAIEETLGRLAEALERVVLPGLVVPNSDSSASVAQMLDISRTRLAALG
jgi:serine/threonine-protein kinase HipA